MFEYLAQLLGQNQVASGGLMVVAASSFAYFVRALPNRIGTFLYRRFVLEIEVRQPDPLYDWLGAWLAEHSVSKRARFLSAITVTDLYSPGHRQTIRLTPGIGAHFIRYGAAFMLIRRSRVEGQGSAGPMASSGSAWERESYQLFIVARQRTAAVELLEAVRKSQSSKEGDGPDVFVATNFGDWNRIMRTASRRISSVITKDEIGERLLARCRRFLESRAEYEKLGVPWRFGILLQGPPGCGKTSLVSALATELGMDIGLLNLSDDGLSDNDLLRLFGQAARLMVVIEDVDAIYNGRKKEEGSKDLSFSGLLNAIDGVAAGTGRIVIMTTNHPEKLDPALTRRGRIDMVVDIGLPSEQQVRQLYRRFHPDDAQGENDFAARHTGKNMADAQEELLAHFAAGSANGRANEPAMNGHAMALRLTN